MKGFTLGLQGNPAARGNTSARGRDMGFRECAQPRTWGASSVACIAVMVVLLFGTMAWYLLCPQRVETIDGTQAVRNAVVDASPNNGDYTSTKPWRADKAEVWRVRGTGVVEYRLYKYGQYIGSVQR